MQEQEFIVRDIKVEGVERTEPGTVFAYLPIRAGETLTQDKATSALRALYATGFFEQVELKRGDQGLLIVQVRERPAISRIEILGTKDIGADKVKESLRTAGIAPARIYNPSLFDQALQELQKAYYNVGKYNVRVEKEVKPEPRNRVALILKVDEGDVAKIRGIRFVGNNSFSERRLSGLFTSTTPGLLTWFNKHDRYSRQTLSADLEKLRSFYLDHGYLEFNIESTQVSITPDKKSIYITIAVREGDPYKVSRVDFAGKAAISAEELKKLVTVRPGETFSRAKLTETTQKVTRRLGDQGYAFANVATTPELDKEKHEVALTLMVDPGKRAYVRRINIRGNTVTKDTVIRRELRQLEGGWYSASQAQLSKDRLGRLGYFSDVSIDAKPVPGAADQVDLDVKVTEQSTGSIMAGVGFATSEGFLLSGGISQNNLFGTGNQLSLSANSGDINTIYSLNFVNPYFTKDGVSLGVELFYHNFDATDSHYSNLSQYSYSSKGGNLQFGLPLTELMRFTLGGGYENTTADLWHYTPQFIRNFYDQYGRDNSTIRTDFALARDSRDSLTYPTRGMYTRLGAEVGVPGSDIEYYKLSAEQQVFWPIREVMALMLRGEIGYGDALGGDDFPFYKNFFVGGSNSVRGFKTGTIGPHDEYRDAMGGSEKVEAGMEFYFPVPGRLEDKTMRLSTFVDAGAVYGGYGVRNNDDFDLSEMRLAGGLAFSWISPFGPIKVSAAVPIRKRDDDRTEPFQFSFGTNF